MDGISRCNASGPVAARCRCGRDDFLEPPIRLQVVIRPPYDVSSNACPDTAATGTVISKFFLPKRVAMHPCFSRRVRRNQPCPSAFFRHENSRRKLQHGSARCRHLVQRGNCGRRHAGGPPITSRRGSPIGRPVHRASRHHLTSESSMSATSRRRAWSARRLCRTPIRANASRLRGRAPNWSSRRAMCTLPVTNCHRFVTSRAKAWQLSTVPSPPA